VMEPIMHNEEGFVIAMFKLLEEHGSIDNVTLDDLPETDYEVLGGYITNCV
ncbi:hypothetical protein L195_g019278, partial [Trifolium pratense]